MSIFNLFGRLGKDKTAFKFFDEKDKAVYTCSHVLIEKSPILYVEHDGEGDWQFLCGNNEHTEENVKMISLLQAVDLDNTLNDLFEMPNGVGATRKKSGEKWEPFRISSEE